MVKERYQRLCMFACALAFGFMAIFSPPTSHLFGSGVHAKAKTFSSYSMEGAGFAYAVPSARAIDVAKPAEAAPRMRAVTGELDNFMRSTNTHIAAAGGTGLAPSDHRLRAWQKEHTVNVDLISSATAAAATDYGGRSSFATHLGSLT